MVTRRAFAVFFSLDGNCLNEAALTPMRPTGVFENLTSIDNLRILIKKGKILVNAYGYGVALGFAFSLVSAKGTSETAVGPVHVTPSMVL
jgi:hypothetical protein